MLREEFIFYPLQGLFGVIHKRIWRQFTVTMKTVNRIWGLIVKYQSYKCIFLLLYFLIKNWYKLCYDGAEKIWQITYRINPLLYFKKKRIGTPREITSARLEKSHRHSPENEHWYSIANYIRIREITSVLFRENICIDT